MGNTGVGMRLRRGASRLPDSVGALRGAHTSRGKSIGDWPTQHNGMNHDNLQRPTLRPSVTRNITP